MTKYIAKKPNHTIITNGVAFEKVNIILGFKKIIKTLPLG